MTWYNKYLNIYGKPFSEVSPIILVEIKNQLASLQSIDPLVSIVVSAYNEEKRLAACLWSLSDLKTQYPIEILGVNNNSNDKTEDVFKALGIPYFNEPRQSPGYARQCGLQNSRGKYHFYVDADTFYPSHYVDIMMKSLTQKNVVCASALWSFYPDANHSSLSLFCYELVRDVFLWLQHFNRPELCVRGMTLAFRLEEAKKVKIRTDIRRGEDGSLALELKKFGNIKFVYNRNARPVTGYGTLGQESLWKSFILHAKYQLMGISRIFYKTDYYEDTEDNLMKNT